MDLSTIIGIVLGFALIVWGIKIPQLPNFWDPQSLALTLGGTVAAVVASFPFSQLKRMGSHFKILVQGGRYNYGALIEQMVEMAQLARQNGLLSLEEKANEIDDPFFKEGLMLVVDATEEEELRARLQNELDNMADRHDAGVAIYENSLEERHKKCSGFWDTLGAMGPAWGMIGTLVGLVNMLKNMNVDEGGASSLGADMSVALVTTFYGCIIANLLMSPIAKKLRIRNDEEMQYRMIMMEGIISIQAGDNPKLLREKLLSNLDQKTQAKLRDGAGEGGGDDGGGKKKKEKKSKK